MIEVKECSKAFGTVKAVNKATLDVGVREVFGLVGSNGAGKSTLLRMMAGIIKQMKGKSRLTVCQCMKMKKQRNCFFISQMIVIFRQIIQQWIWCAFTEIFILSFEPGFFMN